MEYVDDLKYMYSKITEYNLLLCKYPYKMDYYTTKIELLEKEADFLSTTIELLGADLDNESDDFNSIYYNLLKSYDLIIQSNVHARRMKLRH